MRDVPSIRSKCVIFSYKYHNCNANSPFTGRIKVSRSTLQKRAEVGNTDASPDGAPSQYLLVRGLEPGAAEEVLAKGIEKLYKGATASEALDHALSKPKAKVISTTSTTNLGAPKGSLRRVLLIRDWRTEDSWRYGFAEFFTVEVRQSCYLYSVS